MSPEHETPPVPSGHPDPVMVGTGMKSLEDGAYARASYVTPVPDDGQQAPGDRNEPSYFAGAVAGAADAPSAAGDNVTQPATPEDVGMFSKSGKDLLRRLSLVGTTPQELPQTDPREQFPGLRLSGRIISAAFCIPYKLYFRTGSDWVWF